MSRTDGTDETDALALSTAPREHEEDEPDGTRPAEASETAAPQPAGPARRAAREVVTWTRWMWRQLTSMRVALLLLLLLSLAAIPGTLVPQESTDPVKVNSFLADHTTLGPIYQHLQLFDVYGSVWFSAIYLMLFVSLAGCIVPRSWQFVGQLTGTPPRAPSRLSFMPAYATWTTEAAPEVVLDSAKERLRRRRFRVAPGEGSLAAEKGYLREAGNLLFHIALFGLLIAFAWGTLWKSDGTKLVVVGGGFTNNQTQYDDLKHGALFDPDDMAPFGFTLNAFHAAYIPSGPQKGTPSTFEALVSYFNGPDGSSHKTAITVNHPLDIDGNRVYLTSHGYSMLVTVRDGKGNVAYSGPVPFLPMNGNLASQGVVKVPDALDAHGRPEQLGFSGNFFPTTVMDPVNGPQSVFPALLRPDLFLTAYHGDLGMNAGLPQNVYQLDTTNKNLHQFTFPNGKPLSMRMAPGDTLKLPNGAGSITFDRVAQWADFEVVYQPGIWLALASALCMLVGLAASLFVQRRRVWVRALPGPDGRTVVELAGLGRSESPRVAEELAALVAVVHDAAPTAPDTDPDATGDTDADATPDTEADGHRADTEPHTESDDARDAKEHV